VNTLNGIHEGIFMAGWVIGPVLGAVAIASVGAVGAMWFAAAAFVLAAAAVWLLRVRDRVPVSQPEEADEGGNLLRDSWSGVRMLVRDKAVWAITVAVAVLSLAYMPTETVLLPVYFEDLGQPAAFGIILSAMAGGAMIGAFGYGRIAPHFSRRGLALTCMTGACVAYVPIAFLPPLWLFVAAGFLLGFAWGPMEPLLNTLIQSRFPPDHHGRIYGVQLSLFYAAPPLGEIAAGAGVELLGVQPVFAILAIALLATALTIIFLPALRGLDRSVA
jgi:predicted MFS family arabinose efflux permease